VCVLIRREPAARRAITQVRTHVDQIRRASLAVDRLPTSTAAQRSHSAPDSIPA
jgi:hypothetical protein